MATFTMYAVVHLTVGGALAGWVLIRSLSSRRQQWLRSRWYVTFGTRDLDAARLVLAAVCLVLWPVVVAALIDEVRRARGTR